MVHNKFANVQFGIYLDAKTATIIKILLLIKIPNTSLLNKLDI